MAAVPFSGEGEAVSNTVIQRLILLAAVALPLAGCATTDNTAIDHEVARAHLVRVTGSRIQRRVDANGNAVTGSMLQVIDEAQLDAAWGVSLADKLGGH